MSTNNCKDRVEAYPNRTTTATGKAETYSYGGMDELQCRSPLLATRWQIIEQYGRGFQRSLKFDAESYLILSVSTHYTLQN